MRVVGSKSRCVCVCVRTRVICVWAVTSVRQGDDIDKWANYPSPSLSLSLPPFPLPLPFPLSLSLSLLLPLSPYQFVANYDIDKWADSILTDILHARKDDNGTQNTGLGLVSLSPSHCPSPTPLPHPPLSIFLSLSCPLARCSLTHIHYLSPPLSFLFSFSLCLLFSPTRSLALSLAQLSDLRSSLPALRVRARSLPHTYTLSFSRERLLSLSLALF